MADTVGRLATWASARLLVALAATVGASGPAQGKPPATHFDSGPELVARTGSFSIAAATLQPASRSKPLKMRWVVLANGSDLSAQPLLAYADEDDASYAYGPIWWSADSAYHGGLQTADVNGDGYEDIVATSLAGVSMKLTEGGVKVYLGGPRGPAREPVWIGPHFSASDVALADLDANGTLDLVVSSVWEEAARVKVASTAMPFDGIRLMGSGLLSSTWSTEWGEEVLQPAAADALPFGSIWRQGEEAEPVKRVPGGFPAPFELFHVRPDRIDHPPPPAGHVRVFLNTSRGGNLSFREVRTSPLPAPAVSVELADVNLDGWMDLVAGGVGLWLVLGGPPTRGEPGFGAPVLRNVATHFVYDVAVGPRVGPKGGESLLVAASATCLFVHDPHCRPADAGVIAGTPATLFSTDEASPVLDTGSEFPAALGWQDITGDPLPELIVGVWTSEDGQRLGGEPLVYPGTSDAPSPVRADPFSLKIPLKLREHGVMGGDLVFADLYRRDACAAVDEEEFLVEETARSAFTLRAGPVERVESVVVEPPGPRKRCTLAKRHPFTLDGARRTVTIPSVPVGTKVRVTYVPEGTRDMILANPDPMGASVAWEHHACSETVEDVE